MVFLGFCCSQEDSESKDHCYSFFESNIRNQPWKTARAALSLARVPRFPDEVLHGAIISGIQKPSPGAVFIFICKMFTFAEAFPPTSFTSQLLLPSWVMTQPLRVPFQTGMSFHRESVDTH